MGDKESVTIVREATLARLRRVRPVILTVSAPAGFGKTTLIRQYLGVDFAAARCDCVGVRDGRDLARRIFPHLAAELEDGARPLAERLRDALAAWERDPRPAVFFEGADSIMASASALEFLTQLLERRNPGMQIVLASRQPLRLKFTRYAALTDIVLLRAEDIAFDRDDLREAFRGVVDDSATLDRIARACCGWPTAVSLFKRFAQDGRLIEEFDRVERLAAEELHDYIADEIMPSFSASQRAALFVCSALPHATAPEVAIVAPDAPAADDLADLAKDSPFLERSANDGTFIVHPLIAAHVLEHQEGQRNAALRRVAGAAEQARSFERAAELWLAAGDQVLAARALARHDILGDAAPSATYRGVLSRIDTALVQRHPSLWGVSALARIYCVNAQELLDEADALARTIGPEASPADQYFIFVFRTLLMAYLGRAREALPGAEVFLPQSLYLRGFLHARLGQLGAGEDDLNRALSLAGDVDVVAAAILLSLATDIARARGERAEWQFIERSLAHARMTGLPNIVALTLAQGVFGSFFSGDGSQVAQYALELDPFVQGGVRNFAYVAASAQNRAVEPTLDDLPEFVVYGRLIAIAHTRDENERIRYAHSAFSYAKRVGMPFLIVLAAIAVATCDEASSQAHLAIAMREAQLVESEPLAAAVLAVVERRNDCGMLNPFIAQLLRGRFDSQAPIAVDVASAGVRVDGEAVALGGRELELLVAIAQRKTPTSRSQLALMLWPDLDEAAGRNALGVCLHRLRTRLRRKDAIEREGDGYRLHAHADVDLWMFERLDAHAHSAGALRERDRTALERLWSNVRQHQPHRMEHWEWFKPVARRIADARVQLGHRLADDALERDDPRAALQYAQDAIACDTCDERARELAIRAHLAMSDRAAALREYRHYRDALRDDLGVEPSAAISALVVQG